MSTRGEPGNLAGSRAQDRPSQDDPVLHAAVSNFGSSASISCTCKASVSKADLLPLESDETLLSIYTNQLASHFPFVVIPTGTTAKQLRETRPFLMQVIGMVASVRYLHSMRGQSRAVLKHIHDVMLMRSERSLDLLQGILIFLGFYHYFCMSHAHYNNLAQLAVGLVGDMDLNTCPNLKAREEHHRLTLARAEEPRPRTNEERRALLGVWYMASNAALVVKQLGPARYTRYLDQCLQELESAAEYETDQLAGQLVRVQHLTEQIFHFHTGDQLVNELPAIPKAAAAEYLDAFQAELDRLRNDLRPNLKTHPLLSCHYNSASLRIFAPLLADAHLADAVPQPFTSLFHSGLWAPDIFSRFTAALKAWFNHWLTVPVCSYFYLPQPASSQLIYASRNLVEWVRLCGPAAVRFSSTGTAGASLSRKEATTLLQPLPSFIGVPPCPELVAPQPPASASDSSCYAQTILNLLRSEVFAQPQLRVDALGIAEAMAGRFESAKNEMAAAHGGVWENDLWDAAAQQMRMKKARVEKWCESAGAAGIDGENQPLAIPLDHGEATPAWWSSDKSESHGGQDHWQWASDAFDGMDDTAFIEISGTWSTDRVGDMVPTGRLSPQTR
ncbi:uncharacterized protein PV07_12309 [Cladophialophora immunda]|uniref:Transcription factor domain-containing protein n=1 Tax=Cladophialophora immunda TaxID=569365 RepID=A0A0D2AC78_9EURO|nr:uncharacterized protein PV07_12309 [Cladophialophora immunda]KIW22422.1 hypothetical protein PV07_12309 [Cladophialophora immunda]